MTATVTSQHQTEITLPVDGMTCASCVRRVEKALEKVTGVSEASVNLATERARVAFDPGVVEVAQLTAAIERAGYHVPAMPVVETVSTPTPTPHTGEVTLAIDGMTCASCVRRVERALTKVEGVTSANVNLATERATVEFDPTSVSLDDLTSAVTTASPPRTPSRDRDRSPFWPGERSLPARGRAIPNPR